MRILLYILWFLIPIFFFLVATKAKLDRISGAQRSDRVGDNFKQAIFTLACVIICILIDSYILEDLVSSYSPDWIPLGFYQVILLPVILYIGAITIGGGKPIRIEKVTHTSSRNKSK